MICLNWLRDALSRAGSEVARRHPEEGDDKRALRVLESVFLELVSVRGLDPCWCEECAFAERFWSRVRRRGNDQCWPFERSGHPFGYGRIGRIICGKRHELSAHRVSWALANGDIPAGLHVLHRCDNPICVNPLHLFLGTQSDNNADMAAKGRARSGTRRGEQSNTARLNTAQVREIRKRYAAGGVSMRQLAREYGVTFSPVQQILSGKTWSHL